MKTLLRLLSFALLPALAAAAGKSDAKNCGCTCCEGKDVCCCQPEVPSADHPKAAEKQKPAATAEVRHPLRGVIVAVRPDDSALLVKHETIPGYMRAMTMLFKVDPAVLTAFKKGEAITGTLVERDDGFHLENVKAQ